MSENAGNQGLFVISSERSKQMGLALHVHHDIFDVFPSNGGWDGSQTILSTTGVPTVVSTTPVGQSPFNWGVGDPKRGPNDQAGSWAYAILPFIEQESMYLTRAWTFPLRLYACPSRREPTAEEPVLSDRY